MANIVVILEKDFLPNLFVHPKSIDPSIQNSNAFFIFIQSSIWMWDKWPAKNNPFLDDVEIFCRSWHILPHKDYLVHMPRPQSSGQYANWQKLHREKSSSFYTFLRICKSTIIKKCLSVEVSSQNTLGGPKMFIWCHSVGSLFDQFWQNKN